MCIVEGDKNLLARGKIGSFLGKYLYREKNLNKNNGPKKEKVLYKISSLNSLGNS